MLVGKLRERGVSAERIRVPRRADTDLTKWENCQKVVSDVDVVIHAAGRGGGIGYNMRYPGTIFFENIMIGVQLMEAARRANVKKFVTVGTVCSYPKMCRVPFNEEELWEGYPEPTNGPYGMSKKILVTQGEAYRAEFGFNSIHLLLANLYGPGDDFGAERSHAIPAIMKKVHDAKIRKQDLTLWGTGNPSREFLYVDDAAEGICLATEKYDGVSPVNLGTGVEITIRDLAAKIADLEGYEGKVLWNSTFPDGQPRRRIDTRLAEQSFGFRPSTSLDTGLAKTHRWFLEHVVT